jgi:hypothetical protein
MEARDDQNLVVGTHVNQTIGKAAQHSAASTGKNDGIHGWVALQDRYGSFKRP